MLPENLPNWALVCYVKRVCNVLSMQLSLNLVQGKVNAVPRLFQGGHGMVKFSDNPRVEK